MCFITNGLKLSMDVRLVTHMKWRTHVTHLIVKANLTIMCQQIVTNMYVLELAHKIIFNTQYNRRTEDED